MTFLQAEGETFQIRVMSPASEEEWQRLEKSSCSMVSSNAKALGLGIPHCEPITSLFFPESSPAAESDWSTAFERDRSSYQLQVLNLDLHHEYERHYFEKISTSFSESAPKNRSGLTSGCPCVKSAQMVFEFSRNWDARAYLQQQGVRNS